MESAPPHPLGRASAASPAPTVAFLFTLRRDRHPLGRAWNSFFRKCPNGTARVHVHTDPNFKPRPAGIGISVDSSDSAELRWD